MCLSRNSILQGGRYKILNTLGQGGFGITYLAIQSGLDRKVAIKEFFMKELCERDESTSHVTFGTSGSVETVKRFREKFLKEARNIARLNHPNIVRIIDVFEENGTAYYVMDYIEGESLSDMVKRRGSIPEAEAVGYIREVGSALSYIHSRSMNHLDIKPGNIMKRREDGKILVIDFGVAKQYDEVTSEGTTTTPVGISKGYSPNEQYVLSGVQSFSPQSDVYALAATLFKLLTGNTPPEAAIVLDEGLPVGELRAKGISAPVISAIEKAMLPKSRRPQSVDAFLSALSSRNAESSIYDDSTQLICETTASTLKYVGMCKFILSLLLWFFVWLAYYHCFEEGPGGNCLWEEDHSFLPNYLYILSAIISFISIILLIQRKKVGLIYSLFGVSCYILACSFYVDFSTYTIFKMRYFLALLIPSALLMLIAIHLNKNEKNMNFMRTIMWVDLVFLFTCVFAGLLLFTN